MKRLTVTVLAILVLALAPSAAAKPTWTNTRMAGLWVTTDCVSFWDQSVRADCGQPGPLSGINGDGSAMSLSISSGAVPAVRFVDTEAAVCKNLGRHQRFVATGYGTFTVPPDTHALTMNVTFTNFWCGTEASDFDPFTMGLYLAQDGENRDFDSLWDDNPDNTDWGYTWFRA